MFTTWDKAIVAIIMGILFLANTWFGFTIPGFLTSDNITQVLAILSPILVYFFPNKVTVAQVNAPLTK